MLEAGHIDKARAFFSFAGPNRFSTQRENNNTLPNFCKSQESHSLTISLTLSLSLSLSLCLRLCLCLSLSLSLSLSVSLSLSFSSQFPPPHTHTHTHAPVCRVTITTKNPQNLAFSLREIYT